MSRGAITPLYKVPGENAYTFVASPLFPSDSAEAPRIDLATIRLELRKLDVDRRRVETLGLIPFPTTGHHTWTSRNTLLMASGNTIHEWSPARDTWQPVTTLADPDQQYISRIVISPRGDRIALVSMPKDETLIRNARLASNAAIAAYEVSSIVATMEDSVVITRGSGARLTGKAEVAQAFIDGFAQNKDLVYVRTPDRVDVSASEPLAAEQGSWVGRWTTPDGKAATANGTYLVMWRKTVGMLDALPEWKIRSELYVTLGCTNCK
jgi:ketosteroid isomerase-like protein